MQSNKMDRGSEALKSHVANASTMELRQTRKGWLQECFGCEARTEFRYFVEGTQVAESLEDASCCCRFWCAPSHPFTMEVKELNTGAEMLTVDRPCRCGVVCCKCCCYQTATFSSGGQELGSIKEDCFYCVPTFSAFGPDGNKTYKIHQPTCICGMCAQCCSEGNPCFGRGCCKVPFHIFPADQEDTHGDAPYIGKILKKPKSMATEAFTDANAFDVNFPNDATVAEKGLLIGSAILLNAAFFEGGDQGGE